jgi:hypothetical protein
MDSAYSSGEQTIPGGSQLRESAIRSTPVNKLYGKLLEMTYRTETSKKAQDDWEHEKFRWIVGFIIMMKEPLPVGDIAAILDLRRTLKLNPVNVMHFVTNLRTVLVAGTGVITNDTIPRLHKSFVEYITSERADAQFRIDAPAVDCQVATKCLRLVGRLRNGRERFTLLAGSVRYQLDETRAWRENFGVSDAEGLWKIVSAGAAEGLTPEDSETLTPPLRLPRHISGSLLTNPRQLPNIANDRRQIVKTII